MSWVDLEAESNSLLRAVGCEPGPGGPGGPRGPGVCLWLGWAGCGHC